MTTPAMSAFSSGRLPPQPNGANYSPYYRQLYLDDRNRAQGKFAVDVKVLNNLTVTPTFNVRTIPTSLAKIRKV